MSLPNWLQFISVTIVVLGMLAGMGTFLFRLGRGTRGIEDGAREEISKLRWDIEQLGKNIKELTERIDGRYSYLESRQLADHEKISDLITWRALVDERVAALRLILDRRINPDDQT